MASVVDFVILSLMVYELASGYSVNGGMSIALVKTNRADVISLKCQVSLPDEAKAKVVRELAIKKKNVATGTYEELAYADQSSNEASVVKEVGARITANLGKSKPVPYIMFEWRNPNPDLAGEYSCTAVMTDGEGNNLKSTVDISVSKEGIEFHTSFVRGANNAKVHWSRTRYSTFTEAQNACKRINGRLWEPEGGQTPGNIRKELKSFGLSGNSYIVGIVQDDNGTWIYPSSGKSAKGQMGVFADGNLPSQDVKFCALFSPRNLNLAITMAHHAGFPALCSTTA